MQSVSWLVRTNRRLGWARFNVPFDTFLSLTNRRHIGLLSDNNTNTLLETRYKNAVFTSLVLSYLLDSSESREGGWVHGVLW